MGTRFTPQQYQAFKTAMTACAIIFTGGPCNSKMTTTVSMIHWFEAQRKHINLIAPIRSTCNCLSETKGGEAKTIHRLLEFSPQMNAFKCNCQNLLEANVVIVVKNLR